MNNYREEKKRYALQAMNHRLNGDPAIIEYRGSNMLKVLGRRFAKMIKYFQIMHDDKFYISSLAVVTSYACNLNCKGCGQHTPQVKRLPVDQLRIDMEQIKMDLDKITAAVDGVGGIAVADGEGFLNANIGELMEYYGGNPKISSMNIPTNGSVMPKDDDLEKMRRYNVSCSITRYDSVAEATRKRFIDCLQEHQVRYGVFQNRRWYLHEYDKALVVSAEDARKKYAQCEHFFMLRDGQLWRCEVDSTRVKAGIRPEQTGDYIVVKESSVEDVRAFLEEKASLSFLSSCLYCRGGSGPDVVEIPAGEQMEEYPQKEGK